MMITIICCRLSIASVDMPGLETAEAFNKIFKTGHIPLKIHFDKGKEFYNKNVKALFESKNIQYF